MESYIEPSTTFTKRTMRRIRHIEHRRILMRDIFLSAVAIMPFVAREAWLFVRSDYFSVERLPMATFLSKAYAVFLSPVGGNVLILVFVLASAFLLRRLREGYSFLQI